MLRSQLSPTANGVQVIANLHTAMPIKQAIMNAQLPLVLVQYVCGRVAVLRIPDGSVVLMCKLRGGKGQICWSFDHQKAYIIDNGELLEYPIDGGQPTKLINDLQCASFACTEHLLACKTTTGTFQFDSLNPQFTTSNQTHNLYNVIDVVSGQDCVYVVSKDDLGLMANKFNVVISGHIENHCKLQHVFEQLKEQKQRLLKGTEQLCDTLQKWRNKAFIDFISVHQLTHFFVKYDAKDLKRDASELQRLEVLFKDALQSISCLLEDEDEDRLQQFSRSLSRMTVLLRGADDLELMAVRLREVVEDIKLLSSDFDFTVRLILSKCELRLSQSKHNLDSSHIQLSLVPAFECRYRGDEFEDYCCIDGALFVVTTGARKTEHQIYKNNEECQRIQLDGEIHISSPSSFVATTSTGACVFTATGTSTTIGCKPESISGRHGIISCLSCPNNLKIIDLSFYA